HGSLGWYFMDKFVQLPFVIPSLSDQQRGEYLLRLFSGPHAEEAGDSGPPEAQEAEAALRRVLGSGAYAGDLVQQVAGPLQELRHKAPDRAAQYAEQAIERGAHQFTDEDPEIIGQLQAYTPFLGASPRTIKRFANLYRFYRMIQWTRQFQGLEYADPPALGKWLTIMLRWPQLVRWIQWEGEASLPITGAGPTQRAARFEELLHRSADYAAWLDVLDQNAVTRNSWCCDQSLFDLLKRSPEQESDLVRALNVGVW
ncbi:MAG: hypothetical protein HY700_09680, partial [Gemmatimonadetes bacterium]|nr:hypothetical protein [Gemmatimonadota bacterium]